MKILGIDPGFDKLGYAFLSFNQGEVYKINSGIIKTSSDEDLLTRLEFIYSKLDLLLKEYSPEFMVMEDLFFFKNKKTIVKVAQIQGVVLFLAKKRKIKVKILSPLQIKKAITGYGRADKKSVEKMLYLSLQLEKRKREDDEIDAIACALAGFFYLKSDYMKSKLK